MIENPILGMHACCQSGALQICAGGAVGNQDFSGIQPFNEFVQLLSPLKLAGAELELGCGIKFATWGNCSVLCGRFMA